MIMITEIIILLVVGAIGYVGGISQAHYKYRLDRENSHQADQQEILKALLNRLAIARDLRDPDSNDAAQREAWITKRTEVLTEVWGLRSRISDDDVRARLGPLDIAAVRNGYCPLLELEDHLDMGEFVLRGMLLDDARLVVENALHHKPLPAKTSHVLWIEDSNRTLQSMQED
jgi:hypothetical protein